MRNHHILISLLLLGLFCSPALPLANAQKRAIDVKHSVLKVHVRKSGFFSAFGHEHEIEAPIAQGQVDESAPGSVAFRVLAAKLKVLDPGGSDEDRTQVQKTMETKVLDIAQFPEIRFESTAVESKGAARWEVRGDLTLHGETHPVVVSVVRFQDQYRGSATIKQTDFGITPISAGGGTVKVKDELKVEFQIALAP